MKKLAIAGFVIAIGLLVAIPVHFLKENKDENLISSSSDMERYDHHIKVNTDSWKGYKILCGDTMKNMLRQKRIRFECIDDKANYTQRMENLKNGDSQFAVLEVGSYVIEGADFNYPASIIMGIDTSFQGDAVIANKNMIPDIDTLREKENAKVALTLKSPSEMFSKIVSTHYDLKIFENQNNMIESDGAKDAMKKLLKNEVQAAVLWEPYRSIALQDPNMTEIISTKDAQDTIVDVLSVERKFGEENPELVKTVLVSYFKTLKYYKENPDILIKEIEGDHDTKGMSTANIEQMVEGIHWINLTENCSKWFACDSSDWSAKMEIIDTINMTLDVWNTFGDIQGNPLPKQDPYNIVNGEYLVDLYKNGMFADDSNSSMINSLEKQFSSWSDEEWDKAKSFGKLKNSPVKFTKNSELRQSSKEAIDDIATKLKHYPNFRIKVYGHTGTLGDQDKKLSVSQERAEWVKRYLQITYNIDEDRIRAIGLGGSKPIKLKRNENEHSRAYQSKLSRVEVYLIQESY